jgi:hypothetical protein
MKLLHILQDVTAAQLGFSFELGLILKAGSRLENVLPHVAEKLTSMGKAEWVGYEVVNVQATAVVEDSPIEVKPTAPLERKPNRPKERK